MSAARSGGSVLKHDVIVIGAGQAGTPIALRFARAGRSTLLVERAHVGGTCINYGCTPTKTMVASARAAHVARRAGRLGVCVPTVQVDLGAVIDRKDDLVGRWRDGRTAQLRATPGLDLVHGHARFVGPCAIDVGGARHEADTVIINTGARPAVPAIPGIEDVAWMDSTAIMGLRRLPKRLVVLGGGYIGCEFAQMFRRFGSEVTVVGRAPRLIDREDEDVSEALEEAFRAEGIELRLGAPARSVRPRAGGFEIELEGGAPVRGSDLLVAVGRVPNAEGLDPSAAGIELDARGFIVVDDAFRTSAPGVWAVGDVTGGPQFTHNSWDDHRILYDVISGRRAGGRVGRLVPWCVFTDPQVAGVGLTERAARAAGAPYEVATMPFGDIARAVELDETSGLLKVLIDPATERVLGAAIVGIEAGELIHIFVAMMRAGAPARELVEAQAVHPTLAEGVQSLVMSLPRYAPA